MMKELRGYLVEMLYVIGYMVITYLIVLVILL